jgi:hypothetical protein
MNQEPPWERARRYRRLLQEQGFRSIRTLARTIGEDHSRVARLLKILELPERVLSTLQTYADHTLIRAYFTEKWLRELVRQNQSEAAILHEIERILQGPRLMASGSRASVLLASRRLLPIPSVSADGNESQEIQIAHEVLHR